MIGARQTLVALGMAALAGDGCQPDAQSGVAVGEVNLTILAVGKANGGDQGASFGGLINSTSETAPFLSKTTRTTRQRWSPCHNSARYSSFSNRPLTIRPS